MISPVRLLAIRQSYGYMPEDEREPIFDADEEEPWDCDLQAPEEVEDDDE